ncbi:hypothetical protein Astex_0737 [Asticcacaulis excentricus CB 48]|uniref:Uncharacterized protein n=1 Tax=Asticcacaulis excentricus (strain ATCC 15261 / DSM 4724 / KCTC 12464 / NCIMB 9791 / VKM B-1370 / CB 48) TaxID=573065 RepID=E8RKE2_ASTEC|nr:hypothetical protein Astex_0737 [Asticcacaulis excentricus CB 48]
MGNFLSGEYTRLIPHGRAKCAAIPSRFNIHHSTSFQKHGGGNAN